MYSIWVNGEKWSDIIQNWLGGQKSFCALCICNNLYYVSIVLDALFSAIGPFLAVL